MITYEGKVCPPSDGYVAIVVAKFNRTITQRLLDGALAKLAQHHVHEQGIRVAWVPGAFELPIVAKRFAEDEECVAVIGLGAVIKGETPHDEHINRAISLQFATIGIDTGTPVIFGVLTCNTVEQAMARSGAREQSRDKTLDPLAGNKGAEAAEAALEMIDLLEELPIEENDPFQMFSSMMEGRFIEGDFEEDEDTNEESPHRIRPSSPCKKTVKKPASQRAKKTENKADE